MSSCVRFCLFFIWNIHTVFFLPISVSQVLLLYFYIISGHCNSSFFALFLCILRVLRSMHPHNIQCWCVQLLLIFYSFKSFSHQRKLKWPQVSRTLLSILAHLNNAVVWMVSTRPVISKCSSPCTNHLVTVLSTLITIGITILSCSIVFFSPLARSKYLSLFSLPFSFTLWSVRTAKFIIRQFLFFFVDYD